jgi:hypothetical protein
MKSLPELAVVVSVILAFFVSGASIKIQAQDDGVRACVLQATRDFKIVVAPGATIEVERGQKFLGKLYPNMARVKIEGVWYEVSRNNVGGCVSFE